MNVHCASSKLELIESNNGVGLSGVGTLSSLVSVQSPRLVKSTWLILVADKSGSMSGNPWRQVQKAMKTLVADSFQSPDTKCSIVVYNNDAGVLNFDEKNYEGVIDRMTAHGQTSFTAAFQTVANLVEGKSVDIVTKGTDVVIVFLTDGEDTGKNGDVGAHLKTFSKKLQPYNAIVHTVGFTKDHKFEFLDQIRRAGKHLGAFQYAEPGDGPEALKSKLEGVFNYVFEKGMQVQMEVTLNGMEFVGDGEEDGIMLEKNVKFLSVALDREGKTTLQYVVRPTSDAPSFMLRVVDDIGTGAEHLADVQLIKISAQNAVFKTELILFNQELETLITKISSHKSAPSENETNSYLESLKEFQHRLKPWNGSELFKIPQSVRQSIIEQVQYMHNKLSSLFEIVAAWARGQWTNQNRARLADIAYTNMFSKANRQRRMDARAATNATKQKEDALKLERHQVDESKLDVNNDLMEESQNMFNCVLSLNSWVELVKEKDICGFGLAVGRPEFVVDDSTQLRIFEISTTFCAKSSIEDSIKYGINVQGQVATTGGFGIGKELGVATRGRGREPINAWLPLYIHEENWKLIKLQLRQTLGYFVSLDPLGFQVEQTDALFLVLGTMIARTTPETMGERNLLLLLQFIRTCSAIATEMKWFDRIETYVKSAINNLHYDIEHQAKNILVLIAYLFVLDEERIAKLFPSNEHFSKFFMTVMSMAVRRSSFTIFKNTKDEQVRAFVDQLCYDKTATYSNNEQDDTQTMLGLPEKENLLFDNTFIDSSFTCVPAVLQFGNVMNKFGYPTCSSLYSSLSLFLAYRKLVATLPDVEPSKPKIDLLDETYGIAPSAWITQIKQTFDAEYNSCTKDILGYFSLLQTKFGLPHSVELTARVCVALGVQYRVNKVARDAVESATFMDDIQDPIKCLRLFAEQIETHRTYLRNSLVAAQKFQQMTAIAVAREDLGMFAQDLKNLTGGSRGHVGFKPVYRMFQDPKTVRTIAGAAWKLRMLITGKYPQNIGSAENPRMQEMVALDSGSVWIPGKLNSFRFSKVFGMLDIIHIIDSAIANSQNVWNYGGSS